ncbi:MAG: hypothetical protein LBH11_02245 [Propionibacteriaceae bacterium]|jgi:hypothetical protein|nr:hypothetical protein [Propionibacteriaceae bacterium]
MKTLRQTWLHERGVSISVFTVIAVGALLIAGGLAMDGAAAAQAHRRAEAAAAQVARVGADAGAAFRLAGADGGPAALQAARLTAANYPGIEFEMRMSGGQVAVYTTARVDTTFLQFIGIRSLTVSGYASAALIPTPPG